MKPWLKIAIPVGLGVLAGFLNYAGRTAGMAPVSYIKLSQDLAAGDLFKEEAFERLDVPGNIDGLQGSAIPYKDRAILLKLPCPRKLKKGDVLLWRDATANPSRLDIRPDEDALHFSLEGISTSLPSLVNVGDEIGFYLVPIVRTEEVPPTKDKDKDKEKEKGKERDISKTYVGPFRILSIGKRLSAERPEKGAVQDDERQITLAVKKHDGNKLDDQAFKLISARARINDNNLQIYIVAHYLKDKQKPWTEKEPDKKPSK